MHNFNLSKRSQNIPASGIRKFFELAKQMKDPIDLSIGIPHFPPKKELVKKVCELAGEHRTANYTPSQGIAELREKLKKGLSPDLDIIITSGASGGIVLSLLSLFDVGDEILLPDPCFLMYKELAPLFGIEVNTFNTYPNFRFDLEEAEKSVTKKTKGIVVVSPGNPTGIAYNEKDFEKLISFARAHDLWIIFDEIYSKLVFDRSHLSPVYEKTILINGFSKSHGITGWRCGYLTAPTSVVEYMTRIQQYTFVCSPSLFQHALVDNVELDLTEERAYLKRNRDLLVSTLDPRFEVEKPDGAFFAFPKIPIKGFIDECLKREVIVVPGTVFSNQDTNFRISISTSFEKLACGIDRLNSILK